MDRVVLPGIWHKRHYYLTESLCRTITENGKPERLLHTTSRLEVLTHLRQVPYLPCLSAQWKFHLSSKDRVQFSVTYQGEQDSSRIERRGEFKPFGSRSAIVVLLRASGVL